MSDGASDEDPELALSLLHTPSVVRPALATLWRLDRRLGAITEGANRPLAAIKLAWWREALERLDGAPPPAEPLLAAIAADLLPHGITGAALAGVATGWDMLLDDDLADEAARLNRFAEARGGVLFTGAARLLGGAGGLDVTGAGATWALATVQPPATALGLRLAAERLAATPAVRWPRRLRPIGMLWVLARERVRDPHVPAGAPRRIARAWWHMVSGL